MRRRVLFVLAAVLLAGLLGAAPASAAEVPGVAQTRLRGPVYLALGDSVAAGVGASDPATTAYVPRLADVLRKRLHCWPHWRCHRLALHNLGVSGATTASLIADPAQLEAAEAELKARNHDWDPRNNVKVVTIDIGGNDAFAIVPSCLDPTAPGCAAAVQDKLASFEANFDQILGRLRAAAGRRTRIVAMTYYNPLPACQLAPLTGLGDAVLEGGTPLVDQGLNDRIRTVAAAHGVLVAETYGQVGPADLVGGLDCLHPNDAGHQVVADDFAGALGFAPARGV
jgi:lysophospholipase L1-like esterase